MCRCCARRHILLSFSYTIATITCITGIGMRNECVMTDTTMRLRAMTVHARAQTHCKLGLHVCIGKQEAWCLLCTYMYMCTCTYSVRPAYLPHGAKIPTFCTTVHVHIIMHTRIHMRTYTHVRTCICVFLHRTCSFNENLYPDHSYPYG